MTDSEDTKELHVDECTDFVRTTAGMLCDLRAALRWHGVDLVSITVRTHLGRQGLLYKAGVVEIGDPGGTITIAGTQVHVEKFGTARKD